MTKKKIVAIRVVCGDRDCTLESKEASAQLGLCDFVVKGSLLHHPESTGQRGFVLGMSFRTGEAYHV